MNVTRRRVLVLSVGVLVAVAVAVGVVKVGQAIARDAPTAQPLSTPPPPVLRTGALRLTDGVGIDLDSGAVQRTPTTAAGTDIKYVSPTNYSDPDGGVYGFQAVNGAQVAPLPKEAGATFAACADQVYGQSVLASDESDAAGICVLTSTHHIALLSFVDLTNATVTVWNADQDWGH